MNKSKQFLVISSTSEEIVLVKKSVYKQMITTNFDTPHEFSSLNHNINTSRNLSISDTILAIRDFKKKNT